MVDTSLKRGNQTRSALLRAATRIFGQAGFDAASTRAIADAAGANLALINYHFGGKDGLYQAVIAAISAEMETALVPMLDELVARQPQSGAAAVEAILDLFSVIIDQFSREEMHDWSRIIAREQQDPTPAFEVIYERFMSRILDTLASSVTAAAGGAVSAESARIRATLLVGQVLVFVYAPEATQRFLGWSNLGARQKQALMNELRPIVYGQFPEVAS